MICESKFITYITNACVKGFTMSLVCGITIRPLILGGLIAGRNDILVEPLLREK